MGKPSRYICNEPPWKISLVSLNVRTPTGAFISGLGSKLIPQIGYWRTLRESQDSEQQADNEEYHNKTRKENLVGFISVHDTHHEQGDRDLSEARAHRREWRSQPNHFHGTTMSSGDKYALCRPMP